MKTSALFLALLALLPQSFVSQLRDPLPLQGRPGPELLRLSTQDPKKVDPARVDAAIKKGVAHLQGQVGRWGTMNKRRTEELALWTLVHAGVPETDPKFQELLKTVGESKLEWTYNVSLLAMILEELDRVKHQPRIQQCAQFLVDNQCANGQWSYGEPSAFVQDTPTGGAGRDVASGGGTKPKPKPEGTGTRTKPKVVRKVPVKKMREGPAQGDNSNSQYAALGLRACHDAGIVLPKEGMDLAEKWWRESQNEDGGWAYLRRGGSYGSMTAGAVGGLLICDYIDNRPWQKDREVLRGLEWMGMNFSVSMNPGSAADDAGQAGWHYYWLYALERAGIFYGTETVGAHEWYPGGARMLLEAQKPDGSWMASPTSDHAIWDTCFAILFLRRATRPLIDVATGDRYK